MAQTPGNPNTQGPSGNTLRDEHVERLLDHALEETFPASDPIAVSVPPQR